MSTEEALEYLLGRKAARRLRRLAIDAASPGKSRKTKDKKAKDKHKTKSKKK